MFHDIRNVSASQRSRSSRSANTTVTVYLVHAEDGSQYEPSIDDRQLHTPYKVASVS